MSLNKKQAEFLHKLRTEASGAAQHLHTLRVMLAPIALADTHEAAVELLDDVKAAGRFLDRATHSIDAIGCALDRLP